jgi:hypothetical protein
MTLSCYFPQEATITLNSSAVVCKNSEVSLTACSSIAGNSPIINCVWNLIGPNNFSLSGNTSLCDNFYATLIFSGNYSVNLINQHQDGSSSSAQLFDFVIVSDLTVAFTHLISTVNLPVNTGVIFCPPVVCTFNEASTSSNSSITNWYWKITNSGQEIYSSTSQNPIPMQFLFSGNYGLEFIVQDDFGCVDSLEVSTLLIIQVPSGEFSFTQTTNPNLSEYSFNATNLSNVETIRWNMGNGQIIEADFNGFTYEYQTPGIFNPSVFITDNFGCSQNYQLGTIYPATNSIDDISTSTAFSIYPNPAQQSIKILLAAKNKIIDFEIFDLQGKRIISQENFNSQNEIDISKLENGIYLIKLENSVVRFEKI